MAEAGINVAVVGLGFGTLFVPIYRDHPHVQEVIAFDVDPARVDQVCRAYGVASGFSSFEEILASQEIDAVHLVTPIPIHAQQSIDVMNAGKHCACTVPMATTLQDLEALVEAQRESGRNFMMMETSVYTREFLFVQELVEQGELGRIQFLRGAHYQDMEGWPHYWRGLPPMHYATHAISPLLALTGTHATKVNCLGSGEMRPELHEQYGNPYPLEIAIFELEGTSAAAEVTRSHFEVARTYSESFCVYGDRLSFEWQQVESEKPILHRFGAGASGSPRSLTSEPLSIPDFANRLPPEVARYTTEVIRIETEHGPIEISGPHGGSHPHLVHEFVSSIIDSRPSRPDAITSAQWTAAGICAHDSAMLGGKSVLIPNFSG